MLKQPDRHKWVQWFERISDELVSSAVDRHVFDRWWAVITANPAVDVNNRLLALIWVSYFERQALVVRRQLRCDGQSVCLVGLMKEVAAYAPQLKRQEFLNSYTRPEYRDAWREAEVLFDGFAGRSDVDAVSPSLVQRDIDALQQAGGQLLDLADKWLAHSDRSRQWPRLSFPELNGCLDLLYDTWRRYHSLATLGPINADPAFLAGTAWEAVLDIPWRHGSETSHLM